MQTIYQKVCGIEQVFLKKLNFLLIKFMCIKYFKAYEKEG